jgi:hypothetical protein
MNEPTTVLTDFLLSVLGLVLARRLSRSGSPLPVSRRLWGASFVALAVAAVVGGTWHGIPPDVLPTLRRHLWSIAYTAIGLADLLILAGATRAAVPRGPGAVGVLVLLTGRFLAYTALILTQRDFRYVGWDYLVTLLFLFAFGLDLVRRGERASHFVLGSVLLSGAGALVQYLRLSPHPRFNDNDLFHVIQMAGIWLFFRAGLLLRDR